MKSVSVRMTILEFAIWPALFFLTAASTYLLLYAHVSLVTTTIVVLIGLRLSVLVLELVFPRDVDVKFYRDRHTLGDVGYWVVRMLTGRYAALLGAYLMVKSGLIPSIGIWPSSIPFVAQLLLFFLLYEVLNYFLHRLEHSNPVLWSIHSVHHASTQMHHFKKDRDHFLHIVSLYLFIIFPLIYIGSPADFFLWFTLWEGANSTVKHSNVRHKLPLLLHYLVPSADLHHLHHSKDEKQGNSNFANLPLLDLLFGTFTPPDAPLPGYGLKNHPVPLDFVASHVYPFAEIGRRLLRTNDVRVIRREHDRGNLA